MRARTWLAQWQPALADRLVSLPDPFEATGAAEQLEEALRPSVPLAGGGSLIIQPTAAFTAIDVNGGGRRALEANLAAAREIARQLRLRRIGGTIVVDFVDLPARAARARRARGPARRACAMIPSRSRCFRCRASAWSRSAAGGAGRASPSCSAAPCPLCDGAGTVPGLRWRAEELMRGGGAAAAGAAGGHAAPDLHDYLSGAGSGGLAGIRRAATATGRLRRSIGLWRPAGHRIEEPAR